MVKKRALFMKILYIACAVFGVWLPHMSNSFSAIPLETEQLFLRPVQLSDTKDIAEIALNPLVTKLCGVFPPVKTIEDVERFVRVYLLGAPALGILPRYPVSWVMVEKISGRIVGLVIFCAYLERHQRAELAFVAAPDYWNKGYTMQACQAVIRYAFSRGLLRIYATVDPENKVSEHVLQKLQMSFEGVLRSYMIVNGKRVDRKMYAIIASDVQHE